MIETTRFIRRQQPEPPRLSKIIAPRRRGFALTRHVEQDRRRTGAGRGCALAIHRKPEQFLKAAAIVKGSRQFVEGH
ncbi:hypothetical protein [Burkholderia diffusa]|uniref:hypothetical protein n=1 Tax=Burkholderia diffusa TaxID=488732 RepID=UPI002ABD3BB2|nr:hypothetical protein [Burkholderia diffusa]